mmetsp:Transcript_9518/g.28372  ORF Transcript_9518/g.28372 Transcript_9518/m.28372 type:complete len:360 (-) Transcript_9518:579-1658(-)
MSLGYIRRAHHAGKWYSDDKDALDEELSGYLAEAANGQEKEERSSPLRAIISPHAGFSYSGPTAAYAFHALGEELAKPNCPIKHILVLHPSHHVYVDGCAVSGASTIETPLGNLPVDSELRDEILALKHSTDWGTKAAEALSSRYSILFGRNDTKKKKTGGAFVVMDRDVDEAEHSGEMLYPYIAKVQKTASQRNGRTSLIPVLPIMCGSISNAKQSEFGKLLADVIDRKDVVSLISSDFCHWGKNFSYQPLPPTCVSTTKKMEIFEFIESLDRQGMLHIEMKEPGDFAKYIKETKNTVCGQHAIQVWLNAVVHTERTSDKQDEVLDISFNNYAQCAQVRSMADFSVSYASAVARVSTP